MEGSKSLSTIQCSQKSSHVPLSNFASFQSHLSALNTQQRLRPVFHHDASYSAFERPMEDPAGVEEYQNYAWILASFAREHFSPFSEVYTRTRVYPSAIKWMICVYCFISVILFSAALYKSRISAIRAYGTKDPELSTMDTLSIESRLFKLSAMPLSPSMFEPFFIRGQSIDPQSVTACLWLNEDDLDDLIPWVAYWQGPVSLLVVTHTMSPSNEPSTLHQKILGVLKNMPWNVSFSCHLMHLGPAHGDYPNAFLNIARLFAPTASVLLFPGNLSLAPPPTLYSSLVSLTQSPTLVSITSGTSAAYPFSPFSPVFLPRDHPLWCTERFFDSPSRASDWNECLWQLWLESFGNVHILSEPNWQHLRDTHAISSSAISNIIQRRLSARFKSETCVLAMRRIETLGEDDGRTGASRFVVMSHVKDDAWVVHVGLAREGRWWQGQWQEKDVLEVAGRKSSPKILEAFADSIQSTIVRGDLCIENWDPLAESNKDMKLTLGPTANKPLHMHLQEMTTQDAAKFAANEFISIALQARSRQCRLHPSAYDAAPESHSTRHTPHRIKRPRHTSPSPSRASSPPPLKAPEDFKSPAPDDTTESPSPKPSQAEKRSRSSNSNLEAPLTRSKSSKLRSRTDDKDERKGKRKAKPLASEPTQAELLAREEILVLKHELAKARTMNMSQGSFGPGGSSSGLQSRSVAPAQPARRGASLANPNKKARRYKAVEFASDNED
ncbi:hypothetical protein EW146_g5865 [Bondarzewia mesenterica]|uniref:Uncharacterized protein n=1 Tax=Bondarzewia mesenterica TaxID=1095465 RepID=A0A4S4LS19_9AGAM|nr:hypothetical protein EW146_g5865 [Bondarzewia mesenterica]